MRARLEVPTRLGNPNVPSITCILSTRLDISSAVPCNIECGGIEIAPSTDGRGLKDLDEPASLTGMVRRPGADGLRSQSPVRAYSTIYAPTRGDPIRALL
jgi:hypothetical protein